jgi:multimeric flavodoxin WrbA
MKTLAILGSRNPVGQTAQAADAVLKGVESVGGIIDRVFLPKQTLNHCRQCDDDGWGLCKKEGHCVVEDAFALIIDKIKSADAVVFATPVYFFDMSESMGALINRLCRVCFQHPQPGINSKRVLALCVAGGSGSGAIECCFRLEKMLSRCKFNIVEMIPVKRQNLADKMPWLQTIGEAIARYKSTSEK